MTAAIVIGLVVAFLWALQIFDSLSHYWLLRFGIFPRHVGKLEDVASAPFVHASYHHLLGNTLPLLVLGFLVALRGVKKFLLVSAVIVVVSGLGVWLTSPSGSDTVGASGVIFGYLGYLLARGFFERHLTDVLIALIVGALYWSILPDLLPGTAGVSWQAHLFGLLGGVLAARLFRERGRARTPGRVAGPATAS